MKALGVVQSRYSSSRLPGKALMTIVEEPMVLRVLNRLEAAAGLDAVALATSDDGSDDILTTCARDAGFFVSRGPVDDIVVRLRRAAEESGADHLVRAWGDCPFLAVDAADSVLDLVTCGAPMASTNVPGAADGWPAGFAVEAYGVDTLRRLDEGLAAGDPLREFPIEGVKALGLTPARADAPKNELSVYLCVDYEDDLHAARSLAEAEIAAGGPLLRSPDLFPFLAANTQLTGAFSNAPRNVEYQAFKSARGEQG